jgi:hypothetical protein
MLTMTMMTPMTPTYFCHRFGKKGVILYVVIYIMINRKINNSCLEIINTPLSSLSSLAKKGLGEPCSTLSLANKVT